MYTPLLEHNYVNIVLYTSGAVQEEYLCSIQGAGKTRIGSCHLLPDRVDFGKGLYIQVPCPIAPQGKVKDPLRSVNVWSF